MLEAILFLVAVIPCILLGVVTMTVNQNISGFSSGVGTRTFSDELGVKANPTVIAAQAAVLTVRTSGTAGTLTMGSGSHSIITGQRIDLYWSGGAAHSATVGTVSGTSVPFTTAAGTALPIATTVINVGTPVETPFPVVGSNISIFACVAQYEGQFTFIDGGGDIITFHVAASDMFEWDTNSPLTNPLAGHTPTQVWISHGSTLGSSMNMQAVAVSH